MRNPRKAIGKRLQHSFIFSIVDPVHRYIYIAIRDRSSTTTATKTLVLLAKYFRSLSSTASDLKTSRTLFYGGGIRGIQHTVRIICKML